MLVPTRKEFIELSHGALNGNIGWAKPYNDGNVPITVYELDHFTYLKFCCLWE